MDADEEKLLKELKNNPKCQAYLSRFEKESTERFLTNYVSTKKSLLKHGEYLRDQQHREMGHYHNWAEHYYWQIAQKKLFNLECLWRAEKINLPVNVAYEFSYWQNNIKSCPFISTTTHDEIQTMLQYIKNCDPYSEENYEIDYDNFKDNTGIGKSDYYPDWFDFYDNLIGPPGIMALPDVRGEKENRYRQTWHNSKSQPPEQARPISLPAISHDETEDFIKNVEPYKILDYYRIRERQSEDSYFLETMNNIIERLNDEPGIVNIPGGVFPDVLYKAELNLRAEKMEALIPEIHNAHLDRLAMGISYEVKKSLDEDWLVKLYREGVLEGRKILGEPENFDF